MGSPPYVAKATLTESTGPVTSITWAPRHWGLQMATGSADRTLRIYEAVDVVCSNNVSRRPTMADGGISREFDQGWHYYLSLVGHGPARSAHHCGRIGRWRSRHLSLCRCSTTILGGHLTFPNRNEHFIHSVGTERRPVHWLAVVVASSRHGRRPSHLKAHERKSGEAAGGNRAKCEPASRVAMPLERYGYGSYWPRRRGDTTGSHQRIWKADARGTFVDVTAPKKYGPLV
jgi:hypothetical protein